jgi:hypothetical protein
MSYLKTLNSTDVIVTPFRVNKGFSFSGDSELTASDVGIDRFLGTKDTGSIFYSSSEAITGQISTEYQRLVFDSIQELYYSNYIGTDGVNYPYGAPLATSSLVPGNDIGGNRLIGSASSAGRYYNYPQTDLSYIKYFPVDQGDVIGVISIPSKLYGEYIQPNSFRLIADSGSVEDDGEGNLIFNNDPNLVCGNIIYPQGIVIITNGFDDVAYGQSAYGNVVYGGETETGENITNMITSSNVVISFSSSFNIYETQYKCTIRANEYNYSLNPSLLKNYGQNKILLSGSNEYQDFVTGSDFDPYVSTIGLYNENQELLAVGKLTQPLPTSQTTDTTILINVDR